MNTCPGFVTLLLNTKLFPYIYVFVNAVTVESNTTVESSLSLTTVITMAVSVRMTQGFGCGQL